MMRFMLSEYNNYLMNFALQAYMVCVLSLPPYLKAVAFYLGLYEMPREADSGRFLLHA